MAVHLAIAEYGSLEKAGVGLEVLEKSGYGSQEVSLITKPTKVPNTLGAMHDELRGGTATLASTGLGMLVGGSFAAPIAIGTMIGPFIVAGPLAGLAMGGGMGAFLGQLSSPTVKDAKAEYENRVESGSVLVLLEIGSPVRLQDAVNLLKTTDPQSLESFVASAK